MSNKAVPCLTLSPLCQSSTALTTARPVRFCEVGSAASSNNYYFAKLSCANGSQAMSTITDCSEVCRQNGYELISTIADTLQGRLYKACANETSKRYVAIKRASKFLTDNRIAIQDKFEFCVAENIIKEARILKHLTVDNATIGDYIVRYYDFFESDTDYFLVMEYIDSEVNLEQFVHTCHQYIANGKLQRKQYLKVVKYLLWQLLVTLSWMHKSMHCCHLDVTMANILVANANFKADGNGNVVMNPKVCLKLGDFGVSELFLSSDFECEKQGLSLKHEHLFAPNIFADVIFDAQAADSWNIGMILYQCLTGETLYTAADVASLKGAYYALHRGSLHKYLVQRCPALIQSFTQSSLSLLLHLLVIDEQYRLRTFEALRHQFFNIYFEKYKSRISTKFKQQKRALVQQYEKMKTFPYYHR